MRRVDTVTDDWHGAQWVLATWLVLNVVVPPILRAALIRQGYEPEAGKDNARYIGARVADLMAKLALVGVLYWGGFW